MRRHAGVTFGAEPDQLSGTFATHRPQGRGAGAVWLGHGGLAPHAGEGSAEKKDTATILLWLDGGPSQLETYDPKPEAPSEYRGPWGAIPTNVPGMLVSEILPLHARFADRMAFVRSVHHGTGDHFAGGHWMLTGKFGSTSVNLPQKYPSVGSYVSKVRGPNAAGMPAYVGLPAAQSIYLYPGYQGAAYLGASYNPFDVDREYAYLYPTYPLPSKPPACLDSFTSANTQQLKSRTDLLGGLDTLSRKVDRSGMMDSLDRYQQQAMSMILGGRAPARRSICRRRTRGPSTNTGATRGDCTPSWPAARLRPG